MCFGALLSGPPGGWPVARLGRRPRAGAGLVGKGQGGSDDKGRRAGAELKAEEQGGAGQGEAEVDGEGGEEEEGVADKDDDKHLLPSGGNI